MDVIGRQEELEALDGFLESLEAGPAGLVLSGDAGVGKTILWRAGAGAARNLGYQVLETRPAEAEARLAFVGLGDLLGEGLDELLEALSPPQADALRVALLLEQPRGAPPDERAVAVAFLSALRFYASDRPLLLAVDDIQWLDSASTAVLTYAWRRIRNERAGLLAAHRSGQAAPAALVEHEGTQRLEVAPLSLGAVHALLQARIGLVLSRPVLRRLHEVAGGNAFYALELGARSSAVERHRSPESRCRCRRSSVSSCATGSSPCPTDARSSRHGGGPLAADAFAPRTAGHEADALRPALEAHIVELDDGSLRSRIHSLPLRRTRTSTSSYGASSTVASQPPSTTRKSGRATSRSLSTGRTPRWRPLSSLRRHMPALGERAPRRRSSPSNPGG